MKKDDALQIREKVLVQVAELTTRYNLPLLTEDGKLYHAELDGENLWMQRFSRPGVWPHVRAGEAPVVKPGLRYEMWYFAKREEVVVALLLGRGKAIDPLYPLLKPLFTEFVEEGRYARRYTLPDDVMRKVHPAQPGVMRRVPLKKDEKRYEVFEQLLRDTAERLNNVVLTHDPSARFALGHLDECRATSPTQVLLGQFGKKA